MRLSVIDEIPIWWSLPGYQKSRMTFHFIVPACINYPNFTDWMDTCRRNGHYFMMDNGMSECYRYEDGQPVEMLSELPNFGEIADFVEKYGIDEVILPDDPNGDTFYKALSWVDCVPERKRAVVPHGRTVQEWVDCYDRMCNTWGFRTVCIAKMYERDLGRMNLLRHINTDVHDVHFLGSYKNAAREIEAASRSGFVRSFDTAAPLANAQNGHDMMVDNDHYVWNRPWSLVQDVHIHSNLRYVYELAQMGAFDE